MLTIAHLQPKPLPQKAPFPIMSFTWFFRWLIISFMFPTQHWVNRYDIPVSEYRSIGDIAYNRICHHQRDRKTANINKKHVWLWSPRGRLIRGMFLFNMYHPFVLCYSSYGWESSTTLPLDVLMQWDCRDRLDEWITTRRSDVPSTVKLLI